MGWLGPFFVVYFLLAGGATWYVTQPGHPDPASWVQAIWSVAAAILAVLAPIWHAEVFQRSEYRRQKNLLVELVAFADSLVRAAGDASDTVETAMAFRSTYLIAQYRSARDALSTFPVTIFRHEKEARDLMHVRALLVETVDLLLDGEEAFKRSNMSGPMHFHASLGRICTLRQSADAAITALKATN